MKPPTTHELIRISLIAAVFCAIALAAAFAGAGITAFAVLAVIVGPASILLYRALSNPHDASSTDPTSQPHPG